MANMRKCSSTKKNLGMEIDSLASEIFKLDLPLLQVLSCSIISLKNLGMEIDSLASEIFKLDLPLLQVLSCSIIFIGTHWYRLQSRWPSPRHYELLEVHFAEVVASSLDE